MEINKIKINRGLGTFESVESIQFDLLNEKKINIFFMPNSSGKSLIFTGLEHLFSFKEEFFVKKTNQDLGLEIFFELNGDKYIYESSYSKRYKITKNGEEIEKIKDFEDILEEYIGISGEKLEYFKNNRNSLSSINRFNFLNFANFSDKEKSNKISFINSKYDGISKKFILSYVLGANIDGDFFKLITEYEYKKDFIDKNKNKFEKYIDELNNIGFVNKELNNQFSKLENNRINYGDITIAIKELKLLKDEYIRTFSNNKNDDYKSDVAFLNNEIKKIEKEKEIIKAKIYKIREEIRGNKLIEGDDLVKKNIIKKDDLEKFGYYKRYKEELKNDYNILEIDNYLSENIEPSIKKFKIFLGDIYDIFVDKIVEKGLLNEKPFETGNIIFHEEALKIEALFKTSEGIRKTLRILTFIGLHIFANKNKTKCLDYSFYDSFIENIDYKFRFVLFETIIEFVEKNNIDLPKMFFFITKIEEDEKGNSINNIGIKYEKYINIFDSEGINDGK